MGLDGPGGKVVAARAPAAEGELSPVFVVVEYSGGMMQHGPPTCDPDSVQYRAQIRQLGLLLIVQ